MASLPRPTSKACCCPPAPTAWLAFTVTHRWGERERGWGRYRSAGHHFSTCPLKGQRDCGADARGGTLDGRALESGTTRRLCRRQHPGLRAALRRGGMWEKGGTAVVVATNHFSQNLGHSLATGGAASTLERKRDGGALPGVEPAAAAAAGGWRRCGLHHRVAPGRRAQPAGGGGWGLGGGRLSTLTCGKHECIAGPKGGRDCGGALAAPGGVEVTD